MTRSPTRTRLAGLVCGVLCTAAVVPSVAQAVFPGENGRIAFTREHHGNWDIYTMDPGGGKEVRLTFDQAWDTDPAWSPDGTRIAFASARDDPAGDIYVMNANGTDVQAVTDHDGADTSPAWSPDGKTLVFETARQTEWDLYTVNANGTGEAPLPNGGVSGRSPVWSPTGAKIAYECEGIYAA